MLVSQSQRSLFVESLVRKRSPWGCSCSKCCCLKVTTSDLKQHTVGMFSAEIGNSSASRGFRSLYHFKRKRLNTILQHKNIEIFLFYLFKDEKLILRDDRPVTHHWSSRRWMVILFRHQWSSWASSLVFLFQPFFLSFLFSYRRPHLFTFSSKMQIWTDANY